MNAIFTRDTANAVALGMVIGNMLARFSGNDEEGYPEAWQHIGWDQIVNDVDRAAEALDAYQAAHAMPYTRTDGTVVDEFWEEHDWYLTLDKIAEKIWEDPRIRWTGDLIKECLVAL